MPRKDAPSSQTENSIFAQRLRQTMEQMKMTQGDLAKEIGVQRQTVSLYTLGQSSPEDVRREVQNKTGAAYCNAG